MTNEGPRTFSFGPYQNTIIGPELSVGDPAPNFSLKANDLSTVTLDDSRGKTRLISVVPSLDTGICDAQTRRFNEEISKLGDEVVGYTVSVDLPFSQKRWCGNAGVERVQTLSDHFDMNFGKAYGTYAQELRLEQRAVFVVGQDDKIHYAEYLPVAGQHPDYDAALAALKKVAG